MGIFIGGNAPSKIYVGGNEVSRVYIGSNLVWEAGGAPYSPAVLFAASEPGFWATVETSRLWQDTARTTPVTTAGDPVGSWELTTASGVIYATQSTAGSRPVYRIDSDGVSYLDFADSKWLVTPTITPGTDKVQAFVGVLVPAGSNIYIVLEHSPTLDSNNGAFFFAADAQATAHGAWFRSKGTAPSPAQTTRAYNTTTKYVWGGLGDISGDMSKIRVDGTEVVSNTANQGTGDYGAFPLYIGARNGTSLFYNGRIYAAIVRFGPNLTGTDLTDPEDWISGIMNP